MTNLFDYLRNLGRKAKQTTRELRGQDPEAVMPWDVEDAMQAAFESSPQDEADARRAYLADVADKFAQRWLYQRGPDIDGVYGPQSPDLITEYVRQWTPDWVWDCGNAHDLWDHPWKLTQRFTTIPADWTPEKGDIVVIRHSYTHPYGNVGVVMDDAGYLTIRHSAGERNVRILPLPDVSQIRGYFRKL